MRFTLTDLYISIFCICVILFGSQIYFIHQEWPMSCIPRLKLHGSKILFMMLISVFPFTEGRFAKANEIEILKLNQLGEDYSYFKMRNWVRIIFYVLMCTSIYFAKESNHILFELFLWFVFLYLCTKVYVTDYYIFSNENLSKSKSKYIDEFFVSDQDNFFYEKFGPFTLVHYNDQKRWYFGKIEKNNI